MNREEIYNLQKKEIRSGKVLSVKTRKTALIALRNEIKAMEGEIFEALRKDLNKSDFEGFMTEVGMAYSEIGYMLKNLPRFAAKKKVKTDMSQFPSKSYVLPSPYGQVLIISPWNYPFQLTIVPLIDCIAAGNRAIVKPSEYAPYTAKILQSLIEKVFPPEYVAVINGDAEETKALLDLKFDLIFFTGGTSTGKIIAARAAETLTPTVLELGGKSPCIVCSDANIPLTAKRIVFGKFLNAGQTCVAPDYILADRSIKNKLVEALKEQIVALYGENALENSDYPKIINEKHFTRLVKMIDEEKTVFGGDYDNETLKIQPTLLDNVDFSAAAMQEEIFGPILPIISVDGYAEIREAIAKNPNPLALYWFGKDKKAADRAMQEIQFGGGCINDTVIHLTSHEMGFGGIGESGMGAYHGERGFAAFTHYKSIIDKSTKIDITLRYPPYSPKKLKTIRKYMK